MLLKETNEFHEVVFSWEIVTTVWPYSLKKNKHTWGLRIELQDDELSISVCMCYVICTSRTPSWATNLPAADVAPPDRKLEC